MENYLSVIATATFPIGNFVFTEGLVYRIPEELFYRYEKFYRKYEYDSENKPQQTAYGYFPYHPCNISDVLCLKTTKVKDYWYYKGFFYSYPEDCLLPLVSLGVFVKCKVPQDVEFSIPTKNREELIEDLGLKMFETLKDDEILSEPISVNKGIFEKFGCLSNSKSDDGANIPTSDSLDDLTHNMPYWKANAILRLCDNGDEKENCRLAIQYIKNHLNKLE